MFVSSLPSGVCRRAHILLTLFLITCVKWCPTNSVLCFVLFVFVLHTLCCHFSGLSIFDCPFGVLYRLFKTERQEPDIGLVSRFPLVTTVQDINIHQNQVLFFFKKAKQYIYINMPVFAIEIKVI